MKVDFYAPCNITGYNGRLGTKPKCNETLGTILDAIESQLHVDFCDDLAEFIENDKFDQLGYKIYANPEYYLGHYSQTIVNRQFYEAFKRGKENA